MCGYGTLAGIKTDDELRVLMRTGNQSSASLDAAPTSAPFFGDSYNFTMPGSTMGFAINSGRLAGMNAIDHIDSDEFVE